MHPSLTVTECQDYDLASDIDNMGETDVIFAFRAGEGVDQHPNANSGSATINFVTGDYQQVIHEWCTTLKHLNSFTGSASWPRDRNV